METGTQILIERMKTHPEEFLEGKISKWAEVMHMANDCLPDEDREALKQAYTQAKVERFNGEVLATLAGERTPVVETLKYKASERYSQGLTDPRGLFGSAVAKQEGQQVYNPAQNSLTIGSNGTSAVSLMPSAFGAVPRSTHE
jgi:hypothetical protein